MTLEATLDVTVDEDAVFVFHVVNTGPEPVDLTFRSGQNADVSVYAEDNDELVWRWSSDKMFTQAIETETLEPEQTLERVYTWENPPSGDYTAVATLEADVEARTGVSV